MLVSAPPMPYVTVVLMVLMVLTVATVAMAGNHPLKICGIH